MKRLYKMLIIKLFMRSIYREIQEVSEELFEGDNVERLLLEIYDIYKYKRY